MKLSKQKCYAMPGEIEPRYEKTCLRRMTRRVQLVACCAVLLFGSLTMLPAAEQGCYTCTANACISSYEDSLETLRRESAETIAAYEQDYLAVVESDTEEAERLLSEREAALLSEDEQTKVLHLDLITCLQRVVQTPD